MFSVRSKFAAGKLDEKILTEAEFGEADTSLRVQGKAPSERREHFPMDVGRHSLRAECTSPSERGGQDVLVLQIQFGRLSAQVLLAVKLAEKY